VARAGGGEQARAVLPAPRLSGAGDNVALVLRDRTTQRVAVYAPGLGAMEEAVWQAMQQAACVLVDGTFWSDDEMIRLRACRANGRARSVTCRRAAPGYARVAGQASGRHPQDPDPREQQQPDTRRELAEHAELTRRGIEVAWDGLEIEL